MTDKKCEKEQTGSFRSLRLSDSILNALKVKEYNVPSPIQEQTIPAVLAGSDVLAAAQTGTGKTAAYTLPMLQKLSEGRKAGPNKIRALILVPTRELAAQVYDSVVNYGRFLELRSTVAYGGIKINPQMIRLSRGVDILVATPGRLLDLHRQNAVIFTRLEMLILDEADRMLNLGFKEEIEELFSLFPVKRQTLMFTATFTEGIRTLARVIVTEPVEITVESKELTIEAIDQKIYPVDKMRKTELFMNQIDANSWGKILVFVKTKNRADRLCRKLEAKGFLAAAIHGDKTQGARTKALAEFKKDKGSILVATDLAARGLDIDQLPLVVNFDLPHLKEDYIHRIGRTGRAGRVGEAVSFVSFEEFDKLKDIERLIKQLIPRCLVEGFEMDPALPESLLDTRPFPPKKPKKTKKPSRRARE
ncbi:MAG: hypothetical protein B6241_03315 [Spirochaetaceae bacterium 4572_59]|nr:MAG: hypothetical protein B6241_03315 [Spirochaetaceae bacterium 4572_59]